MATKEEGLVFIGKGAKAYGLDELLDSQAEFWGKGTFGSTYKTSLECGDVVAVKRLKVDFSLGIDLEKVEEFGGMIHENLLPPIAYHHSLKETLLLYDYMPTGSLAVVLHGSEGKNKTPLSWEVRIKIAYGVASGIEYLHSQGPIVCHGNIRSSNVFLTKFYDARLSEFGIAQLVLTKSKTDPIDGYRAPEVKNGHEASHEADIYSFGVLLLELLTGKAPMNAIPNNKGVDLAKWVRLMFQEKPILDVFDKELLKYLSKSGGGQMVQILQLAICCTFQYPVKRPSMHIVKNRIKEICG